MFDRCDFLLGDGQSVIIVIPASLPRAETYTVSVSDSDICFRADYNNVARLTYPGGEIFERLINNTQIGLVEFPEGTNFPNHITRVAYVEVRRSAGA